MGKFRICVCAALLWALFAAGAASAVSNDESGPLLRAEKSLRDFGDRAKHSAANITSYALSLIGVDYRFGGNSPEIGRAHV